MLPVSDAVMNRYESILRKRGIAPNRFANYKKWLRYFLDFRLKYPLPDSKTEQMRLFIEKLREKKQTEQQLQQARYAILLYFETRQQVAQPEEVNHVAAHPPYKTLTNMRMTQTKGGHRKSCYVEAGYEVKSDSPEWNAVPELLAAEIKIRHYSRKTLKTYANRSRRFQRYLKNKPPRELSTTDVKEYRTFLAVKCKVAASTQDQALQTG